MSEEYSLYSLMENDLIKSLSYEWANQKQPKMWVKML